MKATDKNLITPQLIPGQAQIGQTDAAQEIQPVVAQQLGHSNADLKQEQPVRLEGGAASSVTTQGENAQLELRKQQRSSGVRTKKLKTESVGSMTRPGRQAFHQVHDLVGQAKNVLGTKAQNGQRE
jgi:hypothetical protein